MKAFALTDVGQRRKINQDCVYASVGPVGNLPNLFIVADGMGGHKAGDFASRFAVNAVRESIGASQETNPIKLIRDAIERDFGQRISNVVVMGTGEPLDNYENVVRFIRMLTDADGHNISERNVTVSTCGIVPGILRLAEEKLSINLALSLHAPNDEMRRKIMPVAKSFTLREIMDALKVYYEATHRRLTFEYSLIAGVNDSDTCAGELAQLLSGMNCLVNLIPVNPVRETGMKAPDRRAVTAFQKKLENYTINVTIRREMGRDIDGACGQLRKRYTETDKL